MGPPAPDKPTSCLEPVTDAAQTLRGHVTTVAGNARFWGAVCHTATGDQHTRHSYWACGVDSNPSPPVSEPASPATAPACVPESPLGLRCLSEGSTALLPLPLAPQSAFSEAAVRLPSPPPTEQTPARGQVRPLLSRQPRRFPSQAQASCSSRWPPRGRRDPTPQLSSSAQTVGRTTRVEHPAPWLPPQSSSTADWVNGVSAPRRSSPPISWQPNTRCW